MLNVHLGRLHRVHSSTLRTYVTMSKCQQMKYVLKCIALSPFDGANLLACTFKNTKRSFKKNNSKLFSARLM